MQWRIWRWPWAEIPHAWRTRIGTRPAAEARPVLFGGRVRGSLLASIRTFDGAFLSMTGAETIRLIMELRRQGITSSEVLAAVERVPRDLFVPETFRDQAFENRALPIASGQTISQPFVVAFMTQMLSMGDRMTVLEVGTGSGYQAAVLARLARRVYSIERFASLSRGAEHRLAQLGLNNVTLRVGDGLKGWPEAAPFDRIILTAWVESTPDELTRQLKPGGILVMPQGDSSDSQRLVKLERTDSGLLFTESISVRFVPALTGVAKDT